MMYSDFVTTGKGLTIHRTTCPNAMRLLSNYGHRVVKTKVGEEQGNLIPYRRSNYRARRCGRYQ